MPSLFSESVANQIAGPVLLALLVLIAAAALWTMIPRGDGLNWRKVSRCGCTEVVDRRTREVVAFDPCWSCRKDEPWP